MDWSCVTAGELWRAWQESDWRGPPRPLREVLSRFSVPKNGQRWLARLKCNAHYFRGNYLAALALPPLFLLFRHPRSLFALLLLLLSLLCANDGFGSLVNEGFVKVLKKINPHAAAVARSALGLGGSATVAAGLGASAVGGPRVPRTKGPRVLGLPRVAACALLVVQSLWVVWRAGGVLRLLSALVLGLVLPVAHASLRSPNLKVRLGSARDEFRAVWRGYQQQQQQFGADGGAAAGLAAGAAGLVGGGGGGAGGVGGMVAGYGIGSYYTGSGSLVQHAPSGGGVPTYGLDAGGGGGGGAYGGGGGAVATAYSGVGGGGGGGGGGPGGGGGGATDYTL